MSSNKWPKEDLRAHVAFMMNLNKSLAERGELVSAEGLATPAQAKRVRAGNGGAPGPGGNPLNMPIEVRQVMSGSPKEFL